MPVPRIVIASTARTPIAKFCGSFQSLKGSELGSIAIKGALQRLDGDVTVSEAYLGNVVSAGMGQAPARQAVLGAGLDQSTVCTTINKVCASGMKSVMLAAQSLIYQSMTNNGSSNNPYNAILAGGFESMSNVPHYLPKLRHGNTLGNTEAIDGVIFDGLWDIYNNQHMGMCAEKCARDYGFTREQQDDYALESYQRAQFAASNDLFTDIVPVDIKNRKGDVTTISRDEEPFSLSKDKLRQLKPAFDRQNGTVTAANASSLNDGAAAIVLMAEDEDCEIKPLARILGFGDAEQDPVDFTTTPALAIPVALENAGLSQSDVDYFEINEAFSVVALANAHLLKLDMDRLNVFGGAVSLGHPIGSSGARIISTLYQVLKHKDASIGCASICNGGGGASAIVIERLD